MNCDDGACRNDNGWSKNFLCMDHGSQRCWFRPILRWFKLDFFAEAFQISEYIFQIPDGSLVRPRLSGGS
jgi:hypothetical protein